MSAAWKDKSMSITQVETALYGLSTNTKLLSKLNIDLKFIETPKTLEDAFVIILNNMYFFQPTEMNSYLETCYSKLKSVIETPYFIYKSKGPDSYMYIYNIYYRLYKNLEVILNTMDTKALGDFKGGVLNSLSKKLYAQSKNRNIKEDDPTDLKIWLEYKLKQIRQWLHRAKSMIIDGISKSRNKVFDFKVVIYFYREPDSSYTTDIYSNSCKFDIKTYPDSVMDFFDILVAWNKNYNSKSMIPAILYGNDNFD